jgi:hypothetical protein
MGEFSIPPRAEFDAMLERSQMAYMICAANSSDDYIDGSALTELISESEWPMVQLLVNALTAFDVIKSGIALAIGTNAIPGVEDPDGIGVLAGLKLPAMDEPPFTDDNMAEFLQKGINAEVTEQMDLITSSDMQLVHVFCMWSVAVLSELATSVVETVMEDQS